MKYKPITLVVVGATGDLMGRKLAPALLQLFVEKKCPPNLRIVGFSRRDWDDQQFRQHIKAQLAKHSSVPASQVNRFLQLLTYCQGNFDNPESYKKLSRHLRSTEAEWHTQSNRLFYLAIPPNLYLDIIQDLSDSGLMKQDSKYWTRLIIEKPFGHNLSHAMAVDNLLTGLFEDNQVYRIDHYLAKEAVQNILAFRFSNNFLQAAWNKNFIERIDIKLWETIDIEGRGEFYDATGALLDVGQNHLLQMLALVAMEQPSELTAELIRRARAAVLNHLVPIKDTGRDSARGQYQGYLKTDEVRPDSTTETYFKIKTAIDLPPWRGVAVYLEGGKKLSVVDKQIIITFRHRRPCMCPPGRHYQNQLFIRIQPDPGIEIRFWSKKPGSKTELEEQKLSFAYEMSESARYKEEYAQLLLDAINGDLTSFVSGEEALASWRFIDPIMQAWHSSKQKLSQYHDTKSLAKISQQVERPLYELKPQVGLVGLGKMGLNMALRLQELGWQVTALTRATEDPQVTTLHDARRFVKALEHRPRIIWLMVPHETVDKVLFGPSGLLKLLDPGDIVVDGGNSYFSDSQRRAEKVTKAAVRFIDVGVSGGPSGARHGASLMIGGKLEDFETLEPLFADIAAPGAYQFFAGYGAGHFVKMVHNGIEYGMMQALAEGFTILRKSSYKLDLSRVAEVYNNGSVIESRLVGWLYGALQLYGENLEEASGVVGHTGEGEWTVQTAKEMKLEAQVIKAALEFRKLSAKSPTYTGQILSVLRAQFGGHGIQK